ncbi:hypothetical protein PPUJ13061_31780 [Pseudomonas putida]|uniref:hypothetical protein n=1 Tax=Pseudomonas putida TaxID=303 RepID=UPI001963A190|nr:hypothetical protein [Pseudomonas putida]WQE51574.1 hypothetical protein U0028_16955 [Pseudomonas putida]GLO03280.1 hypothetical protein PPUJ13061_31780 [Pseudomonas putida]HDS1005812.1 hypothetical protein [Pseudomonas putida]
MPLPYPPHWVTELDDREPLITDPEARVGVLRQMAYDCYRRAEVSFEDMGDMLELADAARDWALMEHEEDWAIGLFGDYEPDHHGGYQVIKGAGKRHSCE